MQAVNRFRRTGAAVLAISFTLCLVVNDHKASFRSARASVELGNQATIGVVRVYKSHYPVLVFSHGYIPGFISQLDYRQKRKLLLFENSAT
jgi:hypothetical protein